MPSAERRKHTRVAESVPCRLGWASHRVDTKTLNLSCGGALCALSEPIPHMTKVGIHLELPSLKIQCTGVVVRQERSKLPGDPAPYQTAIYFSDIHADDRRRLAEFILQSILRHKV